MADRWDGPHQSVLSRSAIPGPASQTDGPRQRAWAEHPPAGLPRHLLACFWQATVSRPKARLGRATPAPWWYAVGTALEPKRNWSSLVMPWWPLPWHDQGGRQAQVPTWRLNLDAHQREVLDQRFQAALQLYNTALAEAFKRARRMRESRL